MRRVRSQGQQYGMVYRLLVEQSPILNHNFNQSLSFSRAGFSLGSLITVLDTFPIPTSMLE